MAFHSGFLPISPKTGFFHAKCVSKRSPTAFLVVVTLCSTTLKVVGCFLFIFATAVANTLSARARTKKSTQKCQKSRFCDFCTKNSTFFHRKQVQKHTLSCTHNRVKLACTNDSPSKNTQSKNFFIPYSKKPILAERGVVPSPSFFSTTRPAREKRFGPSATSVFVLAFHQKPCF